MSLSEPSPHPEPRHDARAAEILGLVRGTFAEKGFDGASMQDLARAAGMSVGNFYRYFPSKAAIVEGLITADLLQIEQDFLRLMSAPDPMEALRRQLRERILDKQNCEDGQLWAEITAAAQRKPEIGATCLRMESLICRFLTDVFAMATGQSREAAGKTFAAEAAFLILLFKSGAMMGAHPPELRAGLTDLLLRTIDQTLDTIAGTRPKG